MSDLLQKPPAGPWIASTTNASGSGGSVSFIQETVGQWLGVLTVVPVLESPVLTPEECYLITVALDHKQLLRDYPITQSEVLRIAADDKAEKVCKCVVHCTDGSNIEPALLVVLKDIMACCAELQGRSLSGNLTNIAIWLLQYILQTGLTDLQVQAKVKSDASVDAAGSKVVVNFGCGEHSLTVEATPDFYVRKQAPIMYLMIGEVESKGSKDPEMQLAIGTLGMVAKRKTTKLVLSS